MPHPPRGLSREARRGLLAAGLAGLRDGLCLAAPVVCVGLFVANVAVGIGACQDGHWWGAGLILLSFTWLYWVREVWPYTVRAWAWQREHWKGRRG